MPELRWILIACGAVLLLGVYLWGRRESKRAEMRDGAVRMRADTRSFMSETAEHFSWDEPLPVSSPASASCDGPDDHVLPADFPMRAMRSAVPVDEAYTEDSSGAVYGASGRHARWQRVEPTLADEAEHDEPAIYASDDEDTQTCETGDANAYEITGELRAEHRPEGDAEQSEVAREFAGRISHAYRSGSYDTQPRRSIERRKIIALRLAAGGPKYSGAQLLQHFEAEGLRHGKYQVFHRLHTEGGQIFSVASMVEPGTFELDAMPSLSYAGVTLFAQLPGPIAGIEALNELVLCGKRLQERLGGTLQDEGGVPLTVHRIERLRHEIREFERHTHREPVIRDEPFAVQ